jgi:hypothetical protein
MAVGLEIPLATGLSVKPLGTVAAATGAAKTRLDARSDAASKAR